MDVKEERILGGDPTRHWYYKAKFKALLDILKPVAVTDILDVGAGSGVFSKMMIQAGKCEHAICLDPAYPCDSVEQYHGHSIRYVRSIDRALTCIHDCERILLFPFNRLAGLTIFCLAEKR